MSETRTTAAEQVLARSRYPHTCSSGITYQLRYVDALTLCEREILPPAFVFGTEEEKLAAMDALDERMKVAKDRLELVRNMVSVALIDPIVWNGPAETKPEGALVPSDLRDDLFELFPVVMEKSDLTAVVIRGAAFRAKHAGAGEPYRPDRDEAGDELPVGDADEPGRVGV